ncbi:MAG TPA: hypothetical protein VGX25_04475 [Actinophytocola sp.]|uniref:hypothetical protein n=1 Tax=Actinophytocola sp. TaxID=1872138 RepID=UPI002DDDBBEA|nr:hypothetical protein [Actinophytocola sp.]HEV2778636.1 hypothetical protein [Actinophytocola sp.]
MRATRRALAGLLPRRISGVTPTLFRPPFGETNDQVRADAARLGMAEALWSVGSRDWAGATTAEIAAAASRLEPGGIILMHEGIQATIDAVPAILSGLSIRGLCPGRIAPGPDGTPVAVAP